MPLINNVNLTDRNNRPPVASRVMLRTYFVNDGMYQDPYAVSSVHIFKRSLNLSPASVLNSDGLVASGSFAAASMVFAASGPSSGIVAPNGGTDYFASALYKGELGGTQGSQADPLNCSGVSGIYKLGEGDFFCVLDGLLASSLSGAPTGQGPLITKNTAEQAVRYLDIWTVKWSQGSAWTTYINQFELFDNTLFTVTEPLMLRASNRLFNRYVIAGSKVNLKIGTEVTVENNSIDDSIKNIFRSASVSAPEVVITKHNEDPSLPSRVVVVSSTDVRVTSENTMIYSFDTNTVFSSDNVITGFSINNLGSRNGTYSLQVSYSLVDEKIVTPLMYFIVK